MGVIDLGQYLRVLVRRWRVVLLLTALGALLALAYAFTQPTRWRSTARLLDLPAPTNVSINAGSLAEGSLNPTINTLTLPPVPTRTLSYVTNGSSEIERRVRERLRAQGVQLPVALRDPGAGAALVQVQEVAGRPNVLEVTATVANDRTLSRQLANEWSGALVEYINGVVGSGFFAADRAEPVVAQAEAELRSTTDALVRFEAGSELARIGSTLGARESQLTDLARESNQVEQNLRNARLLGAQLAGGDGTGATALTLYNLILSTYSSSASGFDLASFLPPVVDPEGESGEAGSQGRQVIVQQPTDPSGGNPVQFQLSIDAVQALSPAEQRALSGTLVTLLERKRTDLSGSITRLQGEVGQLRSRLTAVDAERERLQQERQTSQETYRQLTALVRQEQLSAQIQSAKIKVVDEASDPVRTGLGGLLLPLLGAILGLGAGVLAAFVLEFVLRARRREEPREREAGRPAVAGGR